MYTAPDSEIEEMLNYGFDHGLNIIDTVGSNDKLLAPIGRAMEGRREKIIIQTHFGVVYPGGIYERNRNVDLAKAETERQLKLLGTDYSDIGLVSTWMETMITKK